VPESTFFTTEELAAYCRTSPPPADTGEPSATDRRASGWGAVCCMRLLRWTAGWRSWAKLRTVPVLSDTWVHAAVGLRRG